MGKVGFGELAYWLVAGRRPTPGEVRVFEAVLVALADHGFTPTAIAARLTYLSAPESLQGALAAGLLGGGSRFLGVTEDCGRFLADTLAQAGEVHRLRRGGARRRHPGPAGAPAGPRARAPRAQGAGPAHPRTDPDRHRGGPARPPPAAVRGDRTGAPAGARPDPAAQRRRCLRRGARRPRPPRRDAARFRAAGPRGRAARAPRRGAAPAARHGRSTCTVDRNAVYEP